MTIPAGFVKVRAIDVRPYRYALWCASGDGRRACANQIVHREWTENGQCICFGLDSHNTFRAKPDEELELIPCEDASSQDDQQEFVAQRPTPAIHLRAAALRLANYYTDAETVIVKARYIRELREALGLPRDHLPRGDS
jgi:hypothetical protein